MADEIQSGESENPIVVWEPQPGPQTALIACPVFDVFFGGARGGGKTDGSLGDWMDHAETYEAGANGLIVRRTLKQLKETIERSKELYTPLGARFQGTDKMWTFPNGARFTFAYLENDDDAENYQGHSYTKVYVEEITNFPSPKPIDKLKATLRSGKGVPCTFRANGNPGGPGHGWVKSRYIEPNPQGWQVFYEEFTNPWTKEKLVRDKVFIPSFLHNNRYLGTDYVANLQMVGSPQLVEAWLTGNWDITAGAMFPMADERKHFIPQFEIPSHWYKFRAFDWGSGAPFAVIWIAVSDGSIHGIPRGALVVYREWYGASKLDPTVGLGMSNIAMAQGIKERSPRNEIIQGTVTDKKPFQADGGKTIAEDFRDEGVRLTEGDTGPGSRIQGWAQIRSRLIGINDVPYLFITRNCPHMWRTLTELQVDPDNLEDADTEGEDHLPDALSLGCKARPLVKDEPKHVEVDYNAKPQASAVFEQHLRTMRKKNGSKR